MTQQITTYVEYHKDTSQRDVDEEIRNLERQGWVRSTLQIDGAIRRWVLVKNMES